MCGYLSNGELVLTCTTILVPKFIGGTTLGPSLGSAFLHEACNIIQLVASMVKQETTRSSRELTCEISPRIGLKTGNHGI